MRPGWLRWRLATVQVCGRPGVFITGRGLTRRGALRSLSRRVDREIAVRYARGETHTLIRHCDT